jgi:diketogulonate reductase-like aldo/keto reductase
MEDLFRVPQGDRCATNQVPYSLADRVIEHDLLPWCERQDLPVMAYSPLGGPNSTLLGDPTLAHIGAAHSCSAATIALAWAIRSGKVRDSRVWLSGARKGERPGAFTDAHPAGA